MEIIQGMTWTTTNLVFSPSLTRVYYCIIIGPSRNYTKFIINNIIQLQFILNSTNHET